MHLNPSLIILVAQVAEVRDACREEIEDGEVGEEVSDELLVPCLSVARELFDPSDFFGDRFELLGRRLLGLKMHGKSVDASTAIILDQVRQLTLHLDNKMPILRLAPHTVPSSRKLVFRHDNDAN